MLFSSFVFIWMFLPVVICGNWILQKIGGNKAANVFLLIASIFFYSWGEPIYVFLMITSIVLNWGMGLLVSTGKHRKMILFAAVVLNPKSRVISTQNVIRDPRPVCRGKDRRAVLSP